MLAGLARLRKFLFSDEGRIGRQPFWLYLLGCIVLVLLLFSLPVARLPAPSPAMISILLIFPTYAVLAKRLQDIGIAGQWAIFIVGIGALDALLMAGGPARWLAFIAPLRTAWWWLALANMLVFFAIGLWPGEKRENRFGPPPTDRITAP